MGEAESVVLNVYKDAVAAKSVLAHKSIAKNSSLYAEKEDLVQRLVVAIDSWRQDQGMSIENLLDCYLDLNDMVLQEKMEFLRTGEYSQSDYDSVSKDVYHNVDYMRRYMIGLALTQVFWSSHLRMFDFFWNNLKQCKVSKYLEIGAGHGLFLLFAATYLPGSSDVTAVDISASSIDVAKSMLSANGVQEERASFIRDDFLRQEIDSKADFIVMGELLEHVPNPDDFLVKAVSLLDDNGHLLVTTAINSPAVDHIYHFRNVSQVESLFDEAGLIIRDKLIIPEKECPEAEWEERLLNVNVSYLLGQE